MLLFSVILISVLFGALARHIWLDPVRAANWLWLSTAIRSASVQDGQIVQRRGTAAELIVRGRVGLLAKAIDAAVVPQKCLIVDRAAWSNLDPRPRMSYFSGSVSLPQGWNDVFLRSTGKGHRTYNPIRVGVGEVFVVAGQSNAAGSDPALRIAASDSVRCGQTDSTGRIVWRSGSDPQVPGGGGSVWPLVGDQLQRELRVPVGFINIAVGSTSIRQWQPGTKNFSRLLQTVKYNRPQGIRAILWHQGESDRLMSTVEYYTYLKIIIVGMSEALRPDPPPQWVVARASYVWGRVGEGIRAAQGKICSEGLAFQGPDTDLIGADGRDESNIHLAGSGTAAAAELWSECILTCFFST